MRYFLGGQIIFVHLGNGLLFMQMCSLHAERLCDLLRFNSDRYKCRKVHFQMLKIKKKTILLSLLDTTL